jgi:thymidine kinase
MSLSFDGEIQVITGPMFSGKTSELIRRINRYSRHKRVYVISSSRDDRHADLFISSHDGARVKAVSSITIGAALAKVDLHEVDVVAIDEGQFFYDLIVQSERLANRGKIVIVAGLNGTYKRDVFKDPNTSLSDLEPLAEQWTKLSADCKCGKEAFFSKRLSEEQEEVVTGGEEKYEAVCRKCYHEEEGKKI